MTTVSRYILEEGIEALVTVSLDRESNSLVIQTAVMNHDAMMSEEIYAQEVYSVQDLLDFSQYQDSSDDELSTETLSPYDEDDDIQPYVQPIRKTRVQNND